MNDLVNFKNGVAMVSSKDVAGKFGKIHRDVMRAIENLDCSEEFRVRNFAHSSYISPQKKTLPCVDMTKDGFAFLCMGFTGKNSAEWKEKYISAFNKLEAAVNSSPATMKTLNEIVRQIEGDKEIASQLGRELQRYRKIKKIHAEEFQKASNEAQLALGI